MGWRTAALTVAVLLAGIQAAPAADPPQIAIIIDDMGYRHALGRRALALPGPVAYAVLPDTPHGPKLAEAAHALGREVLLHLPMDPLDARAHPASIGVDSDRKLLAARLRAGLAQIPHVRGINNHQGSLLTASPMHMHWLMDELRTIGGLYFVDSRTSNRSVAYRTALSMAVPAAGRDVFLDAEPGQDFVRAQFEQLIAIARRRGSALAIGHPHPDTLEVLERELPRLAERGVTLVAPSALLRRPPVPTQAAQGGGMPAMPASLSSTATARPPHTAR